jgi:hypothetical protein
MKTSKKVKKKKKEEKQMPTTPREPNPPTWTDAEVQAVADFVNYVHENATFPEMKTAKQARELTNSFNYMANHIKKIEGYIFEVLAVVDTPKGGK